MSAALERVRRFARVFGEHWPDFVSIAVIDDEDLTLDDLKQVLRMASEGVR